jgi:hypothetical protein
MSDDKVLTKEIAVQFLTDRDSVDLSDFITIDNEAARILSQVEGKLDLAGLEYFAETPDHLALVEKLSQHDGDLYLAGLTELSDAAAESLSKHEGDLDLGSLTSLSDAAAESLSKHEGEINLKGLTELSDAAAQSLTKKEPKFRSWEIQLDNLPASAAKILRDAGHG